MLFMAYYLAFAMIVPFLYKRSNRSGELKYLSKEDLAVWQKAMLKMMKEYCRSGYNLRIRQIIYTFANSKIEVIRKTEAGSPRIPIVVLCIRNDLQRVQMLIDHYRRLGVQKFAFLDNNSDDGTFEWLQQQSDIDLFKCCEPYQTLVKEGWINRIVSYYGFDRWYILTDSDELVVYKGMEKHPLADLVGYAEKNGIRRFKGLTLDTYSENRLFGKTDSIKESYCWIDTDSYIEVETLRGNKKVKRMMGGPRYRLMNSNITLSKFPIVFFEPGTISDSAHYQFPHDMIDTAPCNVGILHYKFIDKDLAEYERRAKDHSGFSLNGKFYKQYMNFINSNSDVSFMYEGSRKFTDSSVLDSVGLIESIDLDA